MWKVGKIPRGGGLSVLERGKSFQQRVGPLEGW